MTIYIIYKKIKYYRNSKEICRKSTIDNPMGNVLLYDDYNSKLCSKEDIDTNLNYNYYYDSTDLFLKKNNTRSYITMPSQTHPNDIDKFKKYLYNFNNPSCKYNSIDCIINNDIKYYKNI
jgi:hypothetical protein